MDSILQVSPDLDQLPRTLAYADRRRARTRLLPVSRLWIWRAFARSSFLASYDRARGGTGTARGGAL